MSNHTEIKDVREGCCVWSFMLYIKQSAHIRWSAADTKNSWNQCHKRQRIYHSQGLRILALVTKPKFTISSLMEFKVFDSCTFGSQIDIFRVVMSLARVSHPHAKARDKFIVVILCAYNSITSFEWTSNIFPGRFFFSIFCPTNVWLLYRWKCTVKKCLIIAGKQLIFMIF